MKFTNKYNLQEAKYYLCLCGQTTTVTLIHTSIDFEPVTIDVESSDFGDWLGSPDNSLPVDKILISSNSIFRSLSFTSTWIDPFDIFAPWVNEL